MFDIQEFSHRGTKNRIVIDIFDGDGWRVSINGKDIPARKFSISLGNDTGELPTYNVELYGIWDVFNDNYTNPDNPICDMKIESRY